MGSKYYETPNADRIAAEGMIFTNGYSASQVCSPARASIMSGKFPGRKIMYLISIKAAGISFKRF